jgi:3-oxoacyl-[acyl-carrier protein] reductase
MTERPEVVLVTGASRGVGAAVAVGLARPGRHVVVNYREKARRAGEVVDRVCAAGGEASAVRADLCDDDAVTEMFDDLGRRFGGLDVLVLNASGGLERGAAPDYAMRLNRDAQVQLARRALDMMSDGGLVVFVTSHPAHFFGRAPVPIEGYAPVAQSKHAGETALRGMRDEFASRRVGFVVVSGDLLEGSVAVRLLERVDPDGVAAQRAAGPLPSVDEFADAIVRAIEEPPVTDSTVYVGACG